MAYQGWSNYETWAVKLWLDNEEPSYLWWKERAESYIVDDDEPDTQALADELKAEHESALPTLEGFAGDLLNTAFGEVDWYEMAATMISDAIENREYEEQAS